MLVQTAKRYYTPEEYLDLEEAAEYKSEYRDGVIVPTAGRTTNHNKLALNFATYLKFGLRGQDYDIYMSDVKLWILRYRQYTYPDVMVIKGKPVYTEANRTAVSNPLLIVEALSKSTKNYDQGDKFLYYRSIPELREYILLDQLRYHVIQHSKTDNGRWLLTEYESEESVVQLSSIEFQISLNDIYDRVNFAEDEE